MVAPEQGSVRSRVLDAASHCCHPFRVMIPDPGRMRPTSLAGLLIAGARHWRAELCFDGLAIPLSLKETDDDASTFGGDL